MKRSVFLFLVLAVTASTGALAGDGVVALQTADPSCADDSGNRYVDCLNGTVTDNDTGLVWLKQANCIGAAGGGTGDPLGKVDWFTAMEFVAGLSDEPLVTSEDCGLDDGSKPGEWRLASREELRTMVAQAPALGCTDPPITNDAGTDCWDQDCATAGACSFTGVVTSAHWSANNAASDPSRAFPVSFTGGVIAKTSKLTALYVWPVRAGQ